MTELAEHVSRMAVVVFYTAALIMATTAFYKSRLWARKVSALSFVALCTYWIWFYLVHAGNSATAVVLYSRVGHYFTASAVVIASLLILRADKYGIDLALSRRYD